MRRIALVIGFSLAALAGGAQAQTPQVTVGVGSLLQKKSEDYGRDEVDRLRGELRDDVARALARSPNAPTRVDLIIEDAQPNRPTFAQLSRTPGLSLLSKGLGGAQISGTVTLRDGSVRPLRYQWYETDLRDQGAVATWSDAERGFDYLAGDLARGKVSEAYRGPGPNPHGGHFGQPFNSGY
jgi:hypothetical protein